MDNYEKLREVLHQHPTGAPESRAFDEILRILPILKELGVPIIAIAGEPESSLAREADIVLDAGVEREACPMDLVPTASTTAALAASVRRVMQMQNIAAIATFTASGTTARLMAKNRPKCPILALSSQPTVARRACLYYGVVPLVTELPGSVLQLLDKIVGHAKNLQLATPGDRIAVLTSHPVGTAGGTRGLIVQDVV